MTSDETQSFMKLVKKIKKYPAFEKVRVRFKNLRDVYGRVYETQSGNYIIEIKNTCTFQEAIDTLAHELAHIIVDMKGDHGAVFGILCEAMRNVILILTGEVMLEEKNEN